MHKLPVINGSADLKEALQKLGSIPSRKTLVGNNWKCVLSHVSNKIREIHFRIL